MRIESFEVFATDLPFRRVFKHSAASRGVSESIFVKCTTDSGAIGFGECLPRVYVTGESRDSAYLLLRDRILPRLAGIQFASFGEVWAFLKRCDGKAPADWIAPDVPQTAAWCAVDLALLDACGHVFSQSTFGPSVTCSSYSGVLTHESKGRLAKSCLLFRLYGLRQVKVKVGRECDLAVVRMARRLLGRKADIRVDANMSWGSEQALKATRELSKLGVHCFEQPLPPDVRDDMARLVHQTGLEVMADESFSDGQSLRRLIECKACTAVNVRISKCGGLVATLRRCHQAKEAGLTVQVGCQVGESSLLSAAQLALCSRFPEVAYLEGCFGRRLLREDPVTPVLEFGFGGRPPRIPSGTGFGVRIDEDQLRSWTVHSDQVRAC